MTLASELSINKNFIKKINFLPQEGKYMIDAKDFKFRELNQLLKELIASDSQLINPDSGRSIYIKNVLGHRYIGDGVKGCVKIYINGTAGNDLGAFMDGPEIEVFGSGQDGIGNTMNSGKIIIHGNASDIAGNAMRGGEIYIREDVGYRSGIHMKSYMDKFPVIIIGGKAGNFLGEYMAGGVIILLGIKTQLSPRYRYSLNNNNSIIGNYVGTGMHGGRIYVREDVDNYKLGKEVIKSKVDSDDIVILEKYINNYSRYFKNKVDTSAIDLNDFVKLLPYSHRPYGKLYAY